MFPTLKPTFGTPANNTSFGFSSNVTPNPFGQSTFGKTATPAFGTQSTAFGSPATPLFGATSQHNSLFGTPTQTATFGQNVASQSAFGSGMFGNTTSQPSGSGLFGSANTSAFGQQNKTTAFGFGSNTGNTGFFGQSATQVQPAQQNTGLFGQTSTNLFGASAGFGSTTAGPQMGTVIKFTPVTGTDTMVKGSINQAISTRHHCITCMKDYENKSLEELRWEDYQANRKGPQQGAQPSGGLFGNMSQPVGGGLFGAATTSTSTPGLFGQQDNKSVFGSSAPTPGSGFGQSSSGFGTATANTNTSGLFGNKSLTGFGANATTSSTFPFNSNTQTTHLFGPNTPAKPFGVTSQPNTLFGQPSTFGTQSTFGSFANTQNQVPTNVGLFNQNKTTPFNIGTSTPNTFGSFGQPAAQNTGSLFPSVKTTTGGFSGFGTTTTAPPFGQPSFGQNNQSLFNSSFNKPAQTLFGQPNTTNTLGMGLNMGTGTSLFSNTANKPNTMFGNNMGMFNSGFGNTANTSSFNLGGINTQPGVPNADQANANNEQQIISMSSTPYGLPGLLSNVLEVDNDLKDSTRPTNPGELNALLNTVNKSQSNTVSDKLQPVQVFGRKVPMFDGLEHRDETLISNIRINNNPKRLIIRYNNLNNKDLYDGDSLRVNSSWNMSLTENNSPVKKTLENITDKEQVIDEKRNDRSKNKLVTSLFDAKNTSNVDINDSSLSSTVINLSAKNFESDAEEDKENLEDDVDLFAEASESQDWQNESTDMTLGLNIQPSGQNSTTALNISNKSNLSSGSTSINAQAPVHTQHPTGIVITRPEYYTFPSRDDLVKFISEDGSCIIKGFTIGRVGYGNVYYPDAFDVSNLNIDELVHFRHKEINIYPDESVKPPQGEALNRRAQVTLDKVWPLDKKAKALITDVDTLTKMDYAERLRRLCEKQNTRFVEYRPDTGSWVFKVDHFSKYGHRDSDESDDEAAVKDGANIIAIAMKSPTATTTTTAAAAIAPAKVDTPTMPINSSIDVTMPLGGGLIQNVPEITAAAGLKDLVDHHSLRRFSHHDDSDLYLCVDNFDGFPVTALRLAGDRAKCALMKSTFFEKETIDYDDNISDVGSSDGGILELSNYVSRSSPKRPNIFPEDPICEASLAMDILEDELSNSIICAEEPECVQLSTIQDVIPTNEYHTYSNNVADICAFKGHSFNVGWGKDLSFVSLSTRDIINDFDDIQDSILTSHNHYRPTAIRIVNVNKLNNLYSNGFQSLENHLRCQLEWSTFEMVNNVPHFSSVVGCQLLNGHQKLTAYLPPENYQKQIWDLCVTLWGEISEDELRKYSNRVIRKQLFSKWIKGVVNETVSNELDNSNKSVFQNILTCISGNRIQDAAKLALSSNNFNLSTLIAQLPSTTSARSFAEKQLNQWTQCSIFQHIDPVLFKIYMLISGKPFTDYGDTCMCVYEDMDWMRILAIYFWYIIEPSRSLCDAVNIYEEIFLKYDHTSKPSPPYEYAFENIYDLRFQLLKFYSDNGYPLSQVLNPSTHTDDVLDFSLSWLLLQTLTSLGHSDISKHVKLYMHMNFAAQLEQCGLWHWAIFVLLFIDEVDIKQKQILEILGRHIQLYNESTEEWRCREKMLVQNFHVPQQWIDSAKATLALQNRSYKEAIYYLCYAGKWQEAHDIIMRHFIPDHFLSYDYEFLIKILTPLANHKNSLLNWEEAGGLVLDFAKLGVHYNDIMTLSDPVNIKRNLTDFRSAVLNVSIRFKRFPPLTYMHDVCLAEMSGRIAVMLRKLVNVISGHNYDCTETANSTQELPMTGDYLKQELNSILTDFFSEDPTRREIRKYF